VRTLTIKDIANMAGVSPTVVSFVINNKKGVSKATREKVLSVIERTNYTPSISSRRLIMKKSFNIGIIVVNDSSPFTNLFYYEIAQSILNRSKMYGYNMVFTDIQRSSHRIKLPSIIENKDTDGIIFFQDTSYQTLKEIENRGIPCVVIDAHPGKDLYSMVIADYEHAAVTAMQHLAKMRHRKIAFICSSFLPNFYTQVFNGFRMVMSQNRLPINSGWIQMDAVDEKSASVCMARILDSGDIPTAVFCATDVFAIGAMKCAKARGYRVPEDISFIGIDDVLLAQYVEPALTTVRIDKAEMGNMAMDMVIQRINGKAPECIKLRSDDLIIRDSVISREQADG